METKRTEDFVFGRLTGIEVVTEAVTYMDFLSFRFKTLDSSAS